jgi:suppressor for copper-sensitivity B
VILGAVNAKRNPFIYLNNMGKVMTSTGANGARAAAFIAALAFPIGSVAAETGAWAESAHAKVRLISAVAATGDVARVTLGLEIKLDKGWKTYWRSPGEGGMPPRFDWSGSANLARVETAWPAPKRFEIGGMESVGYQDQVILPLDVSLARPGEPLSVRLQLHYAVCREICMLVESRLTLDLPAAAPASAESLNNGEAIARFQARVPRPGAEHGWSVTGVTVKQMGEGAERRSVIVIDVAAADAGFAAPEALMECPGVRFGKAVTKRGAESRHARFLAPMHGNATPGGDLVLTLIDGERAATFTVPPPAR